MSTTSWLEIDADSPFSLNNIPFGIISTQANGAKRPAVAVGDYVLDLKALRDGDAFSNASFQDQLGWLDSQDLNTFASLGRPVYAAFRHYIRQLLDLDTSLGHLLKDNDKLRAKAIVPITEVKNHLPMRIGDYTDFYAGLNHAFNVGVLLRGADNALQPNYRHLPVAYHGRASSIQVSGQPVRRPCGQIILDMEKKLPSFSACKKLDFELELAAFVCTPNEQGEPIAVAEADKHIFGYVLMNDWSARDIQAFEYVPLGPFNSKNFATTISAWVVLADALEPFRAPLLELERPQPLLPYLREGKEKTGLDIDLKVELAIQGKRHVLSRTNASNLTYSFPQMLAHHTITGCPMNTGDLLGSGTISGTTRQSCGSMMEMSKNGKEPFELEEKISRAFLEDGDEVIFTGVCGKSGGRVGFGECRGIILPSRI